MKSCPLLFPIKFACFESFWLYNRQTQNEWKRNSYKRKKRFKAVSEFEHLRLHKFFRFAHALYFSHFKNNTFPQNRHWEVRKKKLVENKGIFHSLKNYLLSNAWKNQKTKKKKHKKKLLQVISFLLLQSEPKHTEKLK